MEDVIKVLWTGGWDSTYRLLEALLIEGRPVQPYYIVDPTRSSLLQEVRAMDQIRRAVHAEYPDEATRFLPLMIVHLDAIRTDDEISAWFHQLQSLVQIGPQYEWLARFARHHVNELELSVEKFAPEASQLWGSLVPPYIQGRGHDCRVMGPFLEPGLELFSYFRFPVFHLLKSDMRDVAEKNGFIGIIKMCWFCLTPFRGLPCGICPPCRLAPGTGFTYDFYSRTMHGRLYLVRRTFKKKAYEARNLFRGRD
jgi:hypothetical protein